MSEIIERQGEIDKIKSAHIYELYAMWDSVYLIGTKKTKNRKILEFTSLFCRVRFTHTTKQTPRQKMANAIIWLYPPTT